MKIGIVSDSHGGIRWLRAALEAFGERGVQAIVHCGDVCGTDRIDMLAEARVDAYVVAGNMDRDFSDLEQAAQRCGVHFTSEVIEVPLGEGKHLVATHGHDENVLGELIAEQRFGYVCHGHTHQFRDERRGSVRIINPGALSHAHSHTAAVLDTETDTLEWIDLNK